MTGVTINTGISPTVTLSNGEYLTITSAGNISSSSLYGLTGIYAPASDTLGGTIVNAGVVRGGAGENYSPKNVKPTGGGIGMLLLSAVSVSNTGNLGGGAGGAGGYSAAKGVGQAGGNGLDLQANAVVTNSGAISGGAGGYSRQYAAGSGGAGADLLGAATLINAGNISGGTGARTKYGTAGSGGDGVDAAAGGVVNNSGRIVGGNAGSPQTGNNGVAGIGVSLASGATLANHGVIIGGNGSYNHYKTTAGAGAAGLVLAGGAAASNTGTMTGGNGGLSVNERAGAGGNGVSLGAGASFNNSGTLQGGNGGLSSRDYAGHGGNGAYAGNGATLVNGGVIAAGVNGVDDEYKATPGSAGVSLNGGILIDDGTITGGAGNVSHGEYHNYYGARGVAVQFGALAGTLVIEAGAVFNGIVAANAAVADVLEVSGTSAAILTGIGTEFTNFKDISFASGALWTLAGNSSGLAASGETIIGFTFGDALDLTDFAATSASYTASIGLVLSNAGGKETIHLGANSPNAVFSIASDGTHGTEITRLGTHVLSSSYAGQITLSTAGAYLSAFTITTSGTAVAGVYSALPAATLLNLGTIGGQGVNFTAGGTIIDSGTIAGAVRAVYLGGSGHNRLIAEAGAVFSGSVQAAGAGNQLELGGAGSLGGIGSTITGFTSIAFDTGAQWSLAGNSAGLAAGNETITGFTLGDTIDLTDFVATSASYTVGIGLVLSNAGASETIHLGASQPNPVFSIASDDTNGTEITRLGTHTLTTSYAGQIILSNDGAYLSALTITQAGAVSAAAGTGVYSDLLTATLLNQGMITDTSGYGVSFANGGYAANLGSTAVIRGGQTGIDLGNYGTVLNQGTVAAGAGVVLNGSGVVDNNGNAALISGADYGVILVALGSSGAPGPSGTVINQGIITANDSAAHGAAVLIRGIYGPADTLLNSGTIASSNMSGYGVWFNDLMGSGGDYALNTAGADITGTATGIVITSADGTIHNAGSITGTGLYGVALDAGGTVFNSGTITGGKAAVTFGGIGDNLLIITPDAVLNGTALGSKTANNQLELASAGSTGTIAGIGTQFENFSTISIDAGAAWFLSGDSAGLAAGATITGFTGLDRIDLSGIEAISEHFSAGVLSLYGAAGRLATIAIAEGSGITSADFTLASDGANGTEITLCFYPGTQLAAADGAIAVEDIRPGTMLQTASGRYMPVGWVGQSYVDTRFADAIRALPVRILAGALGANLPRRDLLVSPDHALFIDGLLIQAGALVNEVNILREANVPAQFTYYHVELASHELLLAEGVLAESFVDNIDRMHFHNWAVRGVDLAPIEEMSYPRAKSYRQVPQKLHSMIMARVVQSACSSVAA